MKPMEMTNELLTRITRIINESSTDYVGVTPDPPNDRNDGISNHAFRTFMRPYTAMMFNFFKMANFQPQ